MKFKSTAAAAGVVTGVAILAAAAGIGIGWLATYNYGDFSSAIDDHLNTPGAGQSALADAMLAVGVTEAHHKSGTAMVQLTLKGGKGDVTVPAVIDDVTPAFEVTAFDATETADHQHVGPIAVARARVNKNQVSSDQAASLIRATVESGLANYKQASDTESHRVTSWAPDAKDAAQAEATKP